MVELIRSIDPMYLIIFGICFMVVGSFKRGMYGLMLILLGLYIPSGPFWALG